MKYFISIVTVIQMIIVILLCFLNQDISELSVRISEVESNTSLIHSDIETLENSQVLLNEQAKMINEFDSRLEALEHHMYVKDNEYFIVGTTIRNEGEGWYAINEDGHKPIGITSVETTNEAIIINYQLIDQVVSFSSDPDEVMTSEGYSVGASVGLDKTAIYIYDEDNNRIDPNTYINSLGNIWIYGVFIDYIE